ncbi:MAG TPA: cadherin repeat domain-containing protein, partial [Candidatus Binatia bacterium]|nr:cadherin repeat domain-containing protein [Candidatus Binatia bacterium]
ALYGPDGRTLIDSVNFGPQTDDISEGRFPDGAPTIGMLAAPTPREPNSVSGGNSRPQLDAIPSRTIRLGQTVSFTAKASDPDSPPQTLSFSLDAGFPGGAAINASSGLFSWTPTPAQAPSSNTLTVRVTDNGMPPRSAAQSFMVVVLLPPQGTITREGQGMVNLIFDTTPGRTYQVQYKDNLSDKDWLALNPRVVADNATLSSFDSLNSGSQRFYRIVQFD